LLFLSLVVSIDYAFTYTIQVINLVLFYLKNLKKSRFKYFKHDAETVL
jgi:hypothetical protein